MSRIIRFLVLIIVVAAVAGGGYYLFKRAPGGAGLLPPQEDSAKEGYVAVFLANDQVYFGQVNDDGSALVLKDVYYIRLNQTQEGQEANQDQPQLALVKLGDQIHGPVDEMRINKDFVLFVERIKDESTVVRAIKQEKEGRQNGQNTTPSGNQ